LVAKVIGFDRLRRFAYRGPNHSQETRGDMVFSLYAAVAAGFVVAAVIFTVAIPFLVGLFDRHDLF